MQDAVNTPAEKYPFDYDALQKGDVILADRCQAILRVPISDPHYQLKLLNLKIVLARELEHRGMPVTVVTYQGGLKILTDAEAVIYNPQQFEQGLRKAAEAHKRSMLIDRNNLSDDEANELDNRVLVQGRLLNAVRNERTLIRAEPVTAIEKK